jgi:hypothetical protein
MKRKKLPALGTAFLVPLRDGGFALGVLARADGKGSALGYFFGPRVSSADEAELDSVTPEDALLVGMFGDLELIRENWPVLGEIGGWSPDRWLIPHMSRIDEKAGRAWLSTYDDALRCVNETEIAPTEAPRYPYDRLMGAGAVEIRLTKLIKDAEAGGRPGGRPVRG